jgi:ketosteroid isomerase-like protein
VPTDRVAIIRQGVEALNRGDWSAILPHCTADVVLDNTRTRGEYQRIFRGPDEVQRAWESMIDVWEAVHTEIGDPTAIGDRVAVPLFGHFRGRQGIELTTNPAWLFTFRGDKVAEICFYQDEHEALEAAQTPAP